MERVYLQWNLPNWITVVLMAAVGFTVVGAITAGIKSYTGGTGAVTQ